MNGVSDGALLMDILKDKDMIFTHLSSSQREIKKDTIA